MSTTAIIGIGIAVVGAIGIAIEKLPGLLKRSPKPLDAHKQLQVLIDTVGDRPDVVAKLREVGKMLYEAK